MTGPKAGDSVVQLADAGVTIGGRAIWSGMTTQIGAAEFVAVLGPNGVGKSTLLRVILGLQPLSHGTVRVFDRPAGTTNQRIGYLPQRRSFDSSVRVRGLDLVRLGLDGDQWGLPLPGRRSRSRTQRVHQLVTLVGAEDFAARPIGAISGGEQQRLLLAQALAREPDLLLLDEPLDSLDLPTQGAVSALIADVCASQGVAVVMVAHDVNPILPYLDRVIYLADGKAAAGPPRDVITSETLTGLYHSPVEVLTASDGRLVVVGEPEAPAYHADRHQH